MNYLVFLDARYGELEKILSGVKTMLVMDCDPAHITEHHVNPGDTLYFLRDKDDWNVRVKAAVIRVLFLPNRVDQDLSLTLKEMQPRLQFNEEQYNHWSAVQQMLLVEFEAAHKIVVINLNPEKFKDRSSWIAFEGFNQVQV